MPGLPILDLSALVTQTERLPWESLSEADTEVKLLLPLLNYMGWSDSGPSRILRQSATTSSANKGPRHVPDIRLILDGECVVIIESKRASQVILEKTEGGYSNPLSALTAAGRSGLDQVLRYALDDGVPFAWLTNGRQHLVIQVFSPHVPLAKRVVFVAFDSQDLISNNELLSSLQPDRIEHTLAQMQGRPSESHQLLHPAKMLFEALRASLATASRQQLKRLSDTAGWESAISKRPERKHSDLIHVRRTQYLSIFSRFLTSTKAVLIYAGEAGCGKTSFLCELVEQHAGETNCSVLFIDAGTLSVGLFEHIGFTLSSFSQREQERERFLNALGAVEGYALTGRECSLALVGYKDSGSGSDLLETINKCARSSGRDFRRQLIHLMDWMISQFDEQDLRREFLSAAAVCLEYFELISAYLKRLVAEPWKYKYHMPRVAEVIGAQVIGELYEDFKEYRRNRPIKTRGLPLLLSEMIGEIEKKPAWLLEFLRRNPVVLSGENVSLVQYVTLCSALWKARDGIIPSESEIKEGAVFCGCLDKLLSLLRSKGGEELSIEEDSHESSLLQMLVVTNAPRLLIVIDAINEHYNPRTFRVEIEELVMLCAGRLAKVVLTCRTPDLRFFFDRDGEVLRNSYSEGDEINSIEPFSEEELLSAWSRYRAAYDMSGELGPELSWICSTPLMLRFFCEAFAGEPVPEDGTRNADIFARYWERKIRSGVDSRDRENLVLELAQLAADVSSQDMALSLIQLRGVLGTSSFDEAGPLRSLLSESVIVYISPDKNGMAGIRFTYEAFHEYALSRIMLRRVDGGADQAIRELMSLAESSRIYRGALEYVLVDVENAKYGGAAQVVSALIRSKDFQNVGLAVMVKLRNIRSVAAIIRNTWPSQTEVERRTFLKAIARHVELDNLDECLVDTFKLMLEDPSYVACMGDLVYTLVQREPPWIEALPAEKLSACLGLARLWELEESQNEGVKYFIRRSVIGGIVEGLLQLAQGDLSEDIGWYTLAVEDMKKKEGEERAIAENIVRFVSMLLGREDPTSSEWRKFFHKDGLFNFESYQDLGWCRRYAGRNSLERYFPYISEIGKVCHIVYRCEVKLGRAMYHERLQRVLLAYVLAEWASRIMNNKTPRMCLITLVEDAKDIIIRSIDEAWRDADFCESVRLSGMSRGVFPVLAKLRSLIVAEAFWWE